MSMQPKEMVPVPEETARIARAAFPKGNVWLTPRDELGTIFCDDLFADLYPRRGQPAEAPWRLTSLASTLGWSVIRVPKLADHRSPPL